MSAAFQPLDTVVDFGRPESATRLRVASCAARTDQGSRRPTNADALLVTPSLVAVADGVGGRQRGEIASALALEVVHREASALYADADLGRAIAIANEAVWRTDERCTEDGMATTIVVACLGHGEITVGHVGDSRAYLLRQGRLVQLTVDHSLVAAMITEGVLDPSEVRHHPMRSVIVRALGLGPTVTPDIAVTPAGSGDVLLLCTDGLSDAVDQEQLERSINNAPSLDGLVEDLADSACRSGSGDDITIAAVRLG
jgi:PPM family protein phosphatase